MSCRRYEDAAHDFTRAIAFGGEQGPLLQLRSMSYGLLGESAKATRDAAVAEALGWPLPWVRRGRRVY